MRRFADITDLPDDARGAVAAIGNFDGVHRGHQHVIDLARAQAAELAAPLGVVTFEPHPREYFAPSAPPFRLMNAEARANRLEKLGVDLLYEVPFDAALAAHPADAFAERILSASLGLRHVVVGEDFHFGKDRGGDGRLLETLGRDLGFGVTLAPLLTAEGGTASSTRIRAALSEGRPQEAAQMLGHWHRIEGPVLHGFKRGRELGFPTANMALDGLHLPRFGVYAVTVDVLTGAHAGTYRGAASIGTRPVFDGEQPNCETYLFDFEGDLYDAHLSVGLVAFLRPEQKFDGIDALITQMGADCDRARDILADV